MNEDIKEHYRSLYLKHGEAAETGQYSSRESQYLRFKYLAEIADLKKVNILDFGCGTASFYDYLLKIEQKPKKYLGIEIVDEFLEHCKNKIPDASFHKPEEIKFLNYDYGFVSGVFNNLRKNNRNFWKDTVKTIFKYSRKGIAFNMMSTYVDYKDEVLFYESPEDAFTYVKKEITPFVTLRHNYLVKENSIPFEFIIYAYKFPSDMDLNI